MHLPMQEMNPRLLRSCYFDGYECMHTMQLKPRMCYDYEFEYYLKSEGGVMVNDSFLSFTAEDVNFKKPGQTICGIAPYECYIFSFSMNGRYTVPEGYIFGTDQDMSPRYQNELLDSLSDKISLQEHPHIAAMFHQLYVTSQKKDMLSQFHVNRILYGILYELFSLVYPQQRAASSVNPRVIRAIDHIKIFFCDDLRVNDIIEKSGLSKAYFNKCFKEYSGMTPLAMIEALRMEKAQNLLCITNNTIANISTLCGYYDHVYFTYLFKKATGLTPSAYRKFHSYQ